MSDEGHGLRVPEDESTREALTRILAIESRNALARVELAASELSRFESTPAAVDRISTIHQAVSQIDELLGKIDLLASPALATSWPAVDVEEVWQRIRKRLDPTLAARGIRFQAASEPAAVAQSTGTEPVVKTEIRVEMPEAALESILYALLRVVLAATLRDWELRFDLEYVANGLCAALVVVSAAQDRRRLEFDRDDWFELEVALAEWGGTLTASAPEGHDRIQIFLPTGASHA